jgi:hypothetical protein
MCDPIKHMWKTECVCLTNYSQDIFTFFSKFPMIELQHLKHQKRTVLKYLKMSVVPQNNFAIFYFFVKCLKSYQNSATSFDHKNFAKV